MEWRQLNWERNNKYLIQVGGLIRKDFQTRKAIKYMRRGYEVPKRPSLQGVNQHILFVKISRANVTK